jgi:ABC-2 type transport system ATP-binding protein
MQQLKDDGKTIFFNSHLLSEVEMISDRVAIMHQGNLVRQGTVADLTRQEGRFVIGLAPGQTVPTAEIERMGFRCEVVDGRVEVVVQEARQIDPVIQLLLQQGLSLRHLVEKKQTLEDVFVKVVESDHQGKGKAKPTRKPTRRDDGE